MYFAMVDLHLSAEICECRWHRYKEQYFAYYLPSAMRVECAQNEIPTTLGQSQVQKACLAISQLGESNTVHTVYQRHQISKGVTTRWKGNAVSRP